MSAACGRRHRAFAGNDDFLLDQTQGGHVTIERTMINVELWQHASRFASRQILVGRATAAVALTPRSSTPGLPDDTPLTQLSPEVSFFTFCNLRLRRS
jgi:hypothetical protein